MTTPPLCPGVADAGFYARQSGRQPCRTPHRTALAARRRPPRSGGHRCVTGVELLPRRWAHRCDRRVIRSRLCVRRSCETSGLARVLGIVAARALLHTSLTAPSSRGAALDRGTANRVIIRPGGITALYVYSARARQSRCFSSGPAPRRVVFSARRARRPPASTKRPIQSCSARRMRFCVPLRGSYAAAWPRQCAC